METPSPFRVQVPDFQSNIPAYLLQNASAQEKFMMENLSTLIQKTDWQTEQLIKGGESFDRIEGQIKIANGRTSKNEEAIKFIKEATDRFEAKLNGFDAEMKPIRFVKKWGASKWVALGLIVLVCVGIPWINSLHLTLKSFTALFSAAFGA